MREIKFRAWNKELNTMSKPFSFGQVLNFKDKNIKSITDETIMQFTGLTDKNGVDVYEGDILDHYIGKIIVKYESDYCGFNLCYYIHECTVMSEDLEVIGNIYENPELLNK